jgi:spore germination protein KB
MFIFEVGSTTLFALGIEAKQDAWIVILASLLVGLAFIWIYTELQSKFPDKNLAEILIAILGKPCGTLLAINYSIYWLYPACRNLREFGELIVITSLQDTPLTIVLLIFMLASIYVLALGIQVLARTGEITMPVIASFFMGMFLMIILSGRVDWQSLQPVLSHGIKPVLSAVYPTVSIFPFGEIFIFSMYWCYADRQHRVRKATMAAAAASGILLAATLIIDVTVLGVPYTASATIPLFEVIKLINIGDILTNLDALGIIIIFLGGFYKMSLLFYGIVSIYNTLFKTKNSKILLISTGFLVLWVAVVFEPSYIFHRTQLFPFDTDYFYPAFLHVIPVLLLLIHWIKKKSAPFQIK